MSADVKIPPELKTKALNELRALLPAGSFALFTPHDGLIVSPDPMEIARTLVTLAAAQMICERDKIGSGQTQPNGFMRSNQK